MTNDLRYITYGILLSMSLFVLACGSDKAGKKHDHAHHSPQKEEQPTTPADAATRDMISLVDAAVAKINPQKINYYLNRKRADLLFKKLQKQSNEKKLNTEINYAQELLNAGDTDKSIALLIDIISRVEKSNAANLAESVIFLQKCLAIAYMRKGEQENCLQNHTAASCIIPITKEGQHKLKEGSSKAIELFTKILNKNPRDADSRYLLNVAHMTLGQYPDKVPAKFRIPSTYFYREDDFPKFEDIAMNLGVDVSQLSGGTCIDDFNGDGYLDIIASSWGFDHQIRYFEQDKNGSFIDKTMSSGLKGVSGGLNLRHADYNNDGHMDFLILRGAWFFGQGKIPNSLIKNNGDGTFTDVTKSAGLYSENPTQTAVWSDFNLDGWLDLFIANESSDEEKAACELFVSNQDGTFTDQTAGSGLDITGFFKGVSCGDLNNDGYQELYISTLGSDNLLYINKSQQGPVKFNPLTNRGVENPQISFPTWMFDYNNDGFEDIFVSGYSYGKITAADLMVQGLSGQPHPARPHIYRNNRNGSFTEVSAQLGISEPSTTMGCNYGDLDNDGFLDFYLSTGEPSLFSIVPNRVYKNENGRGFKDVTYQGGFGHVQKGHAVGFGDLDMDGDQDIYAVMGGAYEGDVFQNILLENPMGSKNNWINIALEGSASNRSGIGARIQLDITEEGGSRSVYHTVTSGASFGGNSILAEIGLGQAKKIDLLTVHWPNKVRTTTTFKDLPVNMHIKIFEASQRIEKQEIKKVAFNKSGGGHMHH